MPRFADDMYLGPVVGTLDDTAYPPSGVGVGPVGRVYIWDVVPLALNAANIAAAQTLAAPGALVLTAGTGATRVTNARGESVISLDCARVPSVTGNAGAVAQNITIVAYDYLGVKCSQTLAFAGGAITTKFKKAVKSILSITSDAATVGTISIGTSDDIGLPYRVTDRGYVDARFNAGAVVAETALTVADATDPSTALTGDVRGVLTLPSVADGAKRIVARIALPGIAVGPNATRVGALGVLQNLWNQ